MSRSWERKVRKNMNKVNLDRKKRGTTQFVPSSEMMDKFKGRNFISPIFLILFIAMYSVLMQNTPEFKADTMFMVTIGCYIALALLFFFRRPYLTIGKDYVQTRRITGDKRLTPAEIKLIKVQNGQVIIIPNKGVPWTFTRLLNRYPTELMSQKIDSFAKTHMIQIEEK